MPKMRGFKPETWTDEKIVSVSPLARLLFLGMWNYACDNGHVEDSPLQLKMRILPADNCDAAALVVELINAGLIVRMDGYLKVPNLPRHQNIDRRFLALCDHCEHDVLRHFVRTDKLPRSTGKTVSTDPGSSGARLAHDEHTRSARDEVKGSEVKGSESEELPSSQAAPVKPNDPSEFDEFWALYPRKVGKDAARKAFIKAVKRASFESVIDGTQRFADDPNLPEKRFIPHPATWLNAGQWDDEPLPNRGPGQLVNVPIRAWTPPPGSPLSYVEM